MKKLFIIMILAGVFAGVQAQFIQNTAKFETYALTANDTFRIDKADLYAGVCIDVPTGATDSTKFKCIVATHDTYTTDYIKLAPGDIYSLGYNDMIRMDTIIIIPLDVCNLTLTRIKREP